MGIKNITDYYQNLRLYLHIILLLSVFNMLSTKCRAYTDTQNKMFLPPLTYFDWVDENK